MESSKNSLIVHFTLTDQQALTRPFSPMCFHTRVSQLKGRFRDVFNGLSNITDGVFFWNRKHQDFLFHDFCSGSKNKTITDFILSLN